MNTISGHRTLWLFVTALITFGIVLVSILSLKNGYLDIFPYFYLVPILLLAWFYPRYAVYFTVILGWVFLGLIWLYGPADIRFYTSGVAFFYVFVSLGVVVSALSGQLMQERRYRQIVENSQAGILTFDRESGKILEANAVAATMLAYPVDEFLHQHISSLWLDDLQEARFLNTLRQEGRIVNMEIALRRKDRVVIWVLFTASLTREDIIVCSMIDVSCSKRTTDEITESEIRYRTLFDGASDAIFLHDVDGRIFEANVIATRYLGYSKKEFMRMRLQDLDLHPDRLFTPDMVTQLQERGHILFMTTQKRKDGTVLPVEISSRITEYFGMPAVMSTVRDIAERKNPAPGT
jgi:PAS domain S-box-containing protein